MAIGDLAAAAGMAVMDGTEDRQRGFEEINRTRDYIASKTSAVLPVAKGGTGAITAAAARAALGADDAGNLAKGTLPIARGGTGATTAADARTALGVPALGHAHHWDSITGKPVLVSLGYLDQRIAAGSTQPIYSGHGRNNPVSTNYVSAYLNSDGRLGATPSAERFKQDIEPRTYTLDQLRLMQVVIYRIRTAVESLGDDAPFEVGVIAEQLVTAGLSEFVVFDAAGRTQSVAYERLVLVVIGAVQDLADRFAELERRITAIEGVSQ